jgi:hypothetical protein
VRLPLALDQALEALKRDPTHTRRSRRILPRMALAKAGCLVVAIAVLFGIAQAGARYFYCEAIGLSATDPCAQEATHPSLCPLGSFDRQPIDCCRVITMPSMPEGARSVVPVVPSAGVIAILPPFQRTDTSSWTASVLLLARGSERGRAPPTSSGERRAQLMVFLT